MPGDLVEGHVHENRKLAAERRGEREVLLAHRRGAWLRAERFGDDLFKRDQVPEGHPALRGRSIIPTCQRLDPGHHPHRERLAAHRTTAPGGACLARREPLVTHSVPVEVILPLLWKELDGT
jgi:hypothetical protein